MIATRAPMRKQVCARTTQCVVGVAVRGMDAARGTGTAALAPALRLSDALLCSAGRRSATAAFPTPIGSAATPSFLFYGTVPQASRWASKTAGQMRRNVEERCSKAWGEQHESSRGSGSADNHGGGLWGRPPADPPCDPVRVRGAISEVWQCVCRSKNVNHALGVTATGPILARGTKRRPPAAPGGRPERAA